VAFPTTTAKPSPRVSVSPTLPAHRNTPFSVLDLALTTTTSRRTVGLTPFTAVNQPVTPCVTYDLANPACLPGGADGGQGALIDPNYHTPYALQASAAFEHDFQQWPGQKIGDSLQLTSTSKASINIAATNLFQDFPMPADSPNISLFRTDNRSSYNGLAVQLQHRFSNRFELTANYVLSHAPPGARVVGELFDYVNGVSTRSMPSDPAITVHPVKMFGTVSF